MVRRREAPSRTMRPGLLPLVGLIRRLPDVFRHHVPIGSRAEALQNVHEAGVAADQDARLVLLDTLDDPQRRVLRRRLGDGIEPLDRLRAALVVSDAAAGA